MVEVSHSKMYLSTALSSTGFLKLIHTFIIKEFYVHHCVSLSKLSVKTMIDIKFCNWLANGPNTKRPLLLKCEKQSGRIAYEALRIRKANTVEPAIPNQRSRSSL